MIVEMPNDKSWGERGIILYSLARELFIYLQTAIANGEKLNFREMYDRLNTWKEMRKDEQLNKRWHIMHSLLWCAEQASKGVNNDNITEQPEFAKNNPAWTKNCILLLQNEDVSTYSLNIPVATYIPNTGKAFIFNLFLEILKPDGDGIVFHHPVDALMTFPDEDFNTSIQSAWFAALNLLRNDGIDIRFDGRWRLLDRDKKPIPNPIQGKSASGAAARGWWYALQKKMPNEGVIILAQVDDNGVLRDVGGIREKLKAICADNEIGVVIVVSENKKKEALDNVKDIDNNVNILSIEPGPMTLDQLVKITDVSISYEDYPNEEARIRAMIRDSQHRETFEIYGNPSSFDREILNKYYLPETEGGKRIAKINERINNLLKKGWHYGKESFCKEFVINSICIDNSENYADVKVKEYWYCPVYDQNDTFVREMSTLIGPFNALYKLKKFDGRWLIQDAYSI